MGRHPFADEIEALDRDRAALPTAGRIATRVSGGDALAWLNDLVTADLERLEAGEVVRSFLLTPTGRIQADLLIAREPASLLALQTPDQPRSLGELLTPYVLSSDVLLESAETDAVLVGGVRGWRLASEPAAGHIAVGPEALEAWRIRRGVARFPVDLDEESLPAEAWLDREPVIDRQKGCYLGQESVAKVRNLGHPTRVVLPATLGGAASAGDRIRSGTHEVGVLTSLDGEKGIVRIRWAARDEVLETHRGSPVTASYPPTG